MPKIRADLLLVQQGLTETRAQARRLIQAGRVRADGQVVVKPGTPLPPDARLEVVPGPRFVSRGGEKLAAALEAFPVPVEGAVAADVGASTGGFTDCLLQRGARRVYAVDVGRGQLHWKLRRDPRVVVMEGVNARHLARLPEPVELITTDVSFISLTKLWPVLKGWLGPQGGRGVALVKPQFEVGRKAAARGKGVIRDPALWRAALDTVLEAAYAQGYAALGLLPSPVLGPKGNVEFLLHWRYPGPGRLDAQALDAALVAARARREASRPRRAR